MAPESLELASNPFGALQLPHQAALDGGHSEVPDTILASELACLMRALQDCETGIGDFLAVQASPRIGETLQGDSLGLSRSDSLGSSKKIKVSEEEFMMVMRQAYGVVGRRSFDATIKSQLRLLEHPADERTLLGRARPTPLGSGSLETDESLAVDVSLPPDEITLAGRSRPSPLGPGMLEPDEALAKCRSPNMNTPLSLRRTWVGKTTMLPWCPEVEAEDSEKLSNDEDEEGHSPLPTMARSMSHGRPTTFWNTARTADLQEAGLVESPEQLPWDPDMDRCPSSASDCADSQRRIEKSAALELVRSISAASNADSSSGVPSSPCNEPGQKPRDTLIIFDWDDTLCPTTYLLEHAKVWRDGADGAANPLCSAMSQAHMVDDSVSQALEKHVEVASAVLKLAAKCGQVAIVTLARQGWVESSSKNFMPMLWDIIEELQIKVTPARCSYPRWKLRSALLDELDVFRLMKEAAMQRSIKRFYGSRPRQHGKNVLSVGDSSTERDALLEVIMSQFEAEVNDASPGRPCYCKTVKLPENPHVLQLTAKLQVLLRCIEAIARHNGDLDVDLSTEDLEQGNFPGLAQGTSPV